MLRWIEGDDTVDAGLHLHAAGKAKGVADVDEGAARFWCHKAHFACAAGTWGSDLKAPLLAEEEGEGTDVSVLLVADLFVASNLGWKVVHHRELTMVSFSYKECMSGFYDHLQS